MKHQIFENKKVYIVGGGSSLKNFKWDRLDGKCVLAVNRAFEVTQPELIWWSDEQFFGEYKEQLLKLSNVYLATFKSRLGYVFPGNVHQYFVSGVEGYDTHPQMLRTGNSSGFAALSLAIKLGARDIVLLGYDFYHLRRSREEVVKRWHDGYPEPQFRVQEESHLTKKMLPHFDSLLPIIDVLDVKVRNASIDSNLTLFPKILLRDL